MTVVVDETVQTKNAGVACCTRGRGGSEREPAQFVSA
jgi:hypothetical protein